MHLLFWMIGGIVVGWLSQSVRGYRGNRIMNLVMGAAGGVAGGFFVIASPLLIHGRMTFSDLGAIMGAVIMIFLSRYVGASREYDATMVQRTSRMTRSKFLQVTGLIPQKVAYARSWKEGR